MSAGDKSFDFLARLNAEGLRRQTEEPSGQAPSPPSNEVNEEQRVESDLTDAEGSESPTP